MLVGMVSSRCFHAVEIDQFTGVRHVAQHIEFLLGSPCPLCRTEIQRGDLDLVMDPESIRLVEEKRTMWRTDEDPPRNFAKFFSGGTTPGARFSDVAGRLKGQIDNTSAKRRREVCEVGTACVIPLVLGHAHDAYDAGNFDAVRKAGQVCLEYGDESQIVLASFILGQVEDKQKNPVAAARHFEAAARSTDTELRASALLFRALALHGLGDRDSAARVYRSCVDCGRSRVLASAAHRLGLLLEFQGDRAGARAAYETAVGVRDGHTSAKAALNLALMEEADGRWGEAVKLWTYAFTSDSPEVKGAGAFNLGRVAERDGRRRKAKRFYRIAADLPFREAAERAQERLLDMS